MTGTHGSTLWARWARDARALVLASSALAGCETPAPPTDAARPDAAVVDTGPRDAWANDTNVTPGSTWCSVGTPVPEAMLPAGYCARIFSASSDGVLSHSPMREPRGLAFASNGDLFVSAPSMPTPGGASGGQGAILVLTDDDRDGTAEIHTFLGGVPDVHGLVVEADAIYFTTTSAVMRVAYAVGDRAATGTPEMVSTIPSPGRWTHGLARTASGTTYVSNGVVVATCPTADVGYVAELGSGEPTMLARGLRNPMFMRCHPEADLCLVAEMGDDGGASYGAREKLFVLRPGTDYGYPCCAGPDLPATPSASCGAVTEEEIVIPLGNSPFGFDWEPGLWEGSMRGVLCIAQHGSFYSSPPWVGEGVYCTPTDPTTHVPTDGFTMFFGGFGTQNASVARMLRPADVRFSPDGRMFVADDNGDAIYWVAPEGLPRQAP
ncbi:MAG: hypothetical protein U0234_11765 [Sandaracinus sp.]